MATIASQIPKNLSFRYRIGCKKIAGKPTLKKTLDDSYQIPNLGELDGQSAFGDLRIGWSEGGLQIQVEVKAKKKSVWCRETAVLESDGLQLWIDTRDTHNVHRATKFCHWFVLLPSGGGKGDKPIATMLKINRSRDDSPAMNRQGIDISSTVTKTGYKMTCLITEKALHGWNANEHQNLGFNYALIDSEFGWQTMAIGPEMPISEDPSLWQTLTLNE